MRRVAIISPCIIPSAVGHDIIGMYKALRSQNINALMFSENCPPDSDHDSFHHLYQINSHINEDDVVVYHHAIGWDNGLRILKELKCRKIIKYHNVTPPEFFCGINKIYETLCTRGRQQLQDLASMECQLYISDSVYNMRELIEAGVPENKSIVIPPFHNVDRLLSIKAEPIILQEYIDDNFNVLMIGRVVPNKGHIELIEAFAVLQTLLPKSRLFIVGKKEFLLSAYNNKIGSKINSLGLSSRIIVTDEVTDSELKAFYLVSHCFLITSHHEGFCVPLVEAMSMKIPIVAYGSSAIPETAGNAGVILDSNDPVLIATTIEGILKDKNLQYELGEIGHKRYREAFDNKVIEKMFLEAILKYVY